ncbi:competence/damage-inducible protein A [Inediibacterium massiliense]|uniref:competence/damage-inducible protein A n=1 Tax=Inediibacterium massiliense TaxID=1658111 RepID=UPI0006B62AC4|nr:competence/damage-inducible protein A [Inediibacterium massiliense]
MRASIISVGTEILFGQILNTNTQYLTKKLNGLGIDVYYHFTVGDNEKRLGEILNYALEKSDLIIATGGLGPTQDDLTKETISKVMKTNLVIHEPSYERLIDYFKKSNRFMNENNLKQVYLPNESIVLENGCGTAPGFILSKDEKMITCLPGPPKEMKCMFENYVIPYLKERSSQVIHSRILRFFGIGESALETELLDLISNQTNPTLATYAKSGEVSLRVTAKAKHIEEAIEKINPIITMIQNKLGEYLYSCNDEELVEVVAKKLMKENLTISFAESCTGGLLAAKLTDIPGISSSLERSVVTYSNQAKIDELGVKKETLEKYGAVSEQTAKEMAIGLKQRTGSDLCLSVTGIAGPSGGSEDKPVGLVYIGLCYKDLVLCEKHNISGDRNRVRNYTSMLAFNKIRKTIS